MQPTGAGKPLVYFLGDAPEADDDRRGEQFSGAAGRILRRHVPQKWLSRARWNYCVRTHPSGQAPGFAEIECCRPSVEADIVQTQPVAIIGLGAVPLAWALKQGSGIELWSGLRAPVVIGGHACWFYPVVHPSSVLNDRRWRGVQAPGKYGSELEFQLAVNIRDALTAIDAGLPEPVVHTADDAREGAEWVDGGGSDDFDRVRAHLEAVAERKYAGIDYETTAHGRPYREGAKILTAAVSTQADGSLAFPFDHRQARWSKKQRAALDELWRGFLLNAECRKISHHLPFELEWSAFFYGEECVRAGRWEDTHSQAFVIDGRVHDEERQRRGGVHGLGALTLQYFGLDIKTIAGVSRSDLDAEPLGEVLRYNAVDAKYHRLVYGAQAARLRDSGMTNLYRDHLERVPTVVLTQLAGLPVDQGVVAELAGKYTLRMARIEEELRALDVVKKFERQTGRVFRPSANEDVKFILNKVLGHNVANVDEPVLAGIKHDFARIELRWRKAAKLLGTYIVPVADAGTLKELGVEQKREPNVFPDGLLHPITSINKVRTSRTSSEAPNYQNWPKRGANNAVEIRRVIKPMPPLLVVSFDYGQIQARNVAMESLDRALVDSFWSGYDVHSDYMEETVRLYPRWIKEGVAAFRAKDDAGKALVKKYRNISKNKFVFPAFFGAGVRSRSAGMGVPEEVAQRLDDRFKSGFPDIPAWHKRLERNYRKKGYVAGLSEYRRYAPVAWNEIINTPIQADETKIVLNAMTRLSKKNEEMDNFFDRNAGRLLQARMEIHDDLTFIWPKKRVDELAEVVIPALLEVPYAWAKVVPIVVEMEVGEDWASLKAPDQHVFSSHQYDGIDMPKECPL